MKSGLRKIRDDHRDYDFHRSFGSIAPPQFPATFDLDANFWMPNQNLTLTYAVPGFDNLSVPEMDYGCTNWTQADLCVDEDRTLYNPLALEAITHANARQGADIRDALKAAKQAFNRTAFFNIKRAAPLDWYDSLRLVMLSTPEEKRTVSIGVPWFPEFENPAEDGTLPTPTDFSVARATWHNAKIVGWDARGLKVKSWQGALYGERGWCYMPRALINVLMDISGTGAFTLSKLAPQQIETVDLSYIAWFVSLIRNLFATFTQPTDTPAASPHI